MPKSMNQIVNAFVVLRHHQGGLHGGVRLKTKMSL